MGGIITWWYCGIVCGNELHAKKMGNFLMGICFWHLNGLVVIHNKQQSIETNVNN
jgi:hypothetical protein